MWRRSTAAGALALAGSAALIAAFLTPVTATAAPSIRAQSYQYGNWAQVGSGFMTGPDDTMSQVYQLTWRGAFPDLDDTPGPIYAAGTFIKSGSTTINRVAQYDDTTGTWQTLPGDDTGIAPGVGQRIATAANGGSVGFVFPGVYGMVLGGDDSLYVGGSFVASDDTLNNVAQWNGSDWVRMGNGLRIGANNTDNVNDVVQDMVMGNDFIGMDDTNYADDTVYAVGGFAGTCATLACTSTGRTAEGVAQYSQADDTWYPMGDGSMTGLAFAGAYLDDTLYIGGAITNVSGVNVNKIAQWSESDDTWLSLGGGLQGGSVFSMAVHPITRDLYVGGTFTDDSGGAPATVIGVAKWDYEDDTWYSVGSGLTAPNTDDIAFSADGETMWIGSWDTAPTIGGTLANGVAMLTSVDLDDTMATNISGSWNYIKSAGAIGVTGRVVSGLNQKSARAVLAQPGGTAMFGGNFNTAGAVTAGRVALFTPGPEPDPNVPATPPGPPLNVVAKGGWQTVTVSWDPPVDQGTYPITNYLAQATAVGAAPAGNVCITRLTDLKLTECTFTSLKPGVQYTFRVQGLNGGGWGQRSEPSNAAAPYELKATDSERKKRKILFVVVGSEIRVSGTAPGYPAGTRITPYFKVGDTGQWQEGSNPKLKSDSSGRFSWKRDFPKKFNGEPIRVQFGVGNDRSNVIRIPRVG